MSYRLVFAPEAEAQLAALYGYIACAASPNIALSYTEAVVSYCETLRMFPHRGVARGDIRPGLRITNYKKRTTIAFAVELDVVYIIAVFYGGQDYEAILQGDVDQEQSIAD
jgi:plasmid stabilization system protein ParE